MPGIRLRAVHRGAQTAHGGAQGPEPCQGGGRRAQKGGGRRKTLGWAPRMSEVPMEEGRGQGGLLEGSGHRGQGAFERDPEQAGAAGLQGARRGRLLSSQEGARMQVEAPVFSFVAGSHGCRQGRAPPRLGPGTPDRTALLSLLSGSSLHTVRPAGGCLAPPV